MKKLLLLCLALGLTGVASASAEETSYTYLPRDGWTVTTCSEDAREGSGGGTAAHMFDDDLTTYWHSNWSTDLLDSSTETTATNRHWFIIDLGFETQVDGFDYNARQNSGNGKFKAGKVYVSSTPFSITDHDSATTYVNNTDNTPAGEFSFTFTETIDSSTKRCTFDTPATGRYMFVYITNTDDSWACCSEFKVFTSGTVKCQHDTQYWTVTACSQSAYEGSNGPASLMFDDDINTYWHQAWESEATCPHWFIVDMQNSIDVDGFSYYRRQNSLNGTFYTGKVYINDEVFTAFADHTAAQTYYNEESNVAAGSFDFTNEDFTTNPAEAKVCNFSTTAHGRYMLVIIATTSTKDACCGSFKPFYTKGQNLANDFSNGIAAKKTIADRLAPLAGANPDATMPSTTMPEGTTSENIDATIAATNTALQAYIDSFDRKQLTLKCGIRRQDAPYLSAIVSGNGVTFNTVSTVTPDAVWTIQLVDGGIRLYSRTTGLYIGTDQSSQPASDAQTFVPAVQTHNGTDYVMFYKGTTANFLSLDSSGNNLSWYDVAGDEGAPFIAEAADYDYVEPQLSTETEKRWYRIVNARWMYQYKSPNMAVNGENQNGNAEGEANSRAQANIPGIYWSIENAGQNDNSVKLVNLTGLKLADNSTMTTKGSPLYLYKQDDAQFNGKTVYGISKSSDSTEQVYYDANVDSGTIAFQWTPTSDQAGNDNNGSAWYFILASDDEITNATSAYISAVTDRISKPVSDENLATLMGEEFMSTIEEQYGNNDDLTTIAGVNAAKSNGPTRVAAVKAAVEAAIGDKLADNVFMIQNANTDYSNCFLSNTLSDDTYQTSPTAETNDLNALWSFEPTEDGGYILRSSGSGKAITKTDETSKPLPLDDTGLAYTIGYNPVVPGFNITLVPNDEITDVTYYALHQTSNSTICKWATNNIAGSHWHFNTLEEAQVEFAKVSDGHTMTLGEGVTLNTHETASNLTMTISKLAAESETARVAPTDGVHTISASDFSDGTVSLSGLTEGTYTVSAPAGMFLVNGKHATLNSTFTIDNNGDPTAIDEIEAANADATVIYDLQGRRVNRAAHGLYIVNGRKVIL